MNKIVRRTLKTTGVVLYTLVVLAVGIVMGAYNISSRQNQVANLSLLNAESIANDVNSFRKINGKPELKYNFILQQSADSKCQDMVNNDYFGHMNPKTRQFGYAYITQLLPDATVSEDITTGSYEAPQEPIDSFAQSPPHRESLLGDYTDIGVDTCHRPSEAPDSQTVVIHLAKL